ncbi:MAG: squalene synthase HpnC [Noviherbaspirillum sp.]
MPVDHYENFPVASILLPARLRAPVEAVYAFARSADDIADEGDAGPQQRLAALMEYEAQLDRMARGGMPDGALFARLAEMVKAHCLPLQPLRDLLSAFRQDVVTVRYPNHEALLDYCRRSANPVGALMLHLYGVQDAASLRQSDAVCSALQLTNFWQDVGVDWDKGRIYIPLDEMARFGVEEAQIACGQCDERWRALMRFEVDRTRALMHGGAPLALRLPGRVGWELRLVIQGGLRILERIEQADYDVFRRRPVLGRADWLRILWRAARMRAAPV